MNSIIEKTPLGNIFTKQVVSNLDIYQNENIGDKIKLIRIKSALTYKQFSLRLGVSIMTIYRWEKGLRIPNKNNLTKLLTIIKT